MTLDSVDLGLLGNWQRGFPVVARPFAVIGTAEGVEEDEVLERLARLHDSGAVSRVGATLRPNTAGASTLAAVAAPEWRIDEVAEVIGAEPGVNHSYLRENDWNLWFVATGPDRDHVDATLARIRAATGLAAIDLPLIRPYNIDLGFALDGVGHMPVPAEPDPSALVESDRAILQGLTRGLAIVPSPFATLAEEIGRPEAEITERIGVLSRAGIISRLGIILRHRALGWRSNAMVVWDVPAADVDRIGVKLSAQPGITLCYRRRPDPARWPWNLYCMIHSRSREAALETLERAADAAGIAALDHRVLFSVRCFKQTGAMVMQESEAAA